MTVATCVCCSMTSDSHAWYGSPLFHGKSLRPWRSYQRSSRGPIRALFMRERFELVRARLQRVANLVLHQPRADQGRHVERRHQLRAVLQTRLPLIRGDAPLLGRLAEIAQRRVDAGDDGAVRPLADAANHGHGTAKEQHARAQAQPYAQFALRRSPEDLALLDRFEVRGVALIVGEVVLETIGGRGEAHVETHGVSAVFVNHRRLENLAGARCGDGGQQHRRRECSHRLNFSRRRSRRISRTSSFFCSICCSVCPLTIAFQSGLIFGSASFPDTTSGKLFTRKMYFSYMSVTRLMLPLPVPFSRDACI